MICNKRQTPFFLYRDRSCVLDNIKYQICMHIRTNDNMSGDNDDAMQMRLNATI